MHFAQYMEIANDSVALLVQAEHIDAVNCIESIVQIDGLDGIMLGPCDLSASMGKMGQVTDREVTGAIDRIHQACQSASSAIGYFGVNAEAVRPYQRKGNNLILAGGDTLHLGGAAKQMLNELSSVQGDRR